MEAPCWRPWGWVTTVPSGVIGVSAGKALRTALGDHFRRMVTPEYFACSIVWSWSARRSPELERERDAVLEEEAPDKAEEMIQQLAGLRGIGVQSATVLVREAARARNSPNGKARQLASTPGSARRRSAPGIRNVSKE